MPVESPYLTADEAWTYLRLPSIRALYVAVERHAIPVCRVGRKLLFDKADLDKWVRGELSLEKRAREWLDTHQGLR